MTVKVGSCQTLYDLPFEIRVDHQAQRRATFSECGTYRYELVIREPRGFGVVVFVMLNPSTADEMKDDPTVRRCRGFAVRWGCQEVRVVNLFALRSTDPKALYKHEDPIGPGNDEAILRAADGASRIIAAWGVHGVLRGRAAQVSKLLYRFQVFCLGRAKDGSPRHPLYIANDTKLEDWRRP